ncbi:MAG: nuclear transport factor 2 family protein, partial [Dehalococcoidia bacterium]
SDDDSDGAASADVPNVTDATARDLTNQFITLLQKKDTTGLTAFLDDGFMLQRADGSFAVKADYLKNLPSIGNFTITNVSFKQRGDTFVVRWDLTVNETIDGKEYSGSPAPRLSTFVYHDNEWRMFSHANFNAPAQSAPPAAPVN